MLMPHSPINECEDNLLEMDMLNLPPTHIVGTGMDSYPPAEILGTAMHPDPQNEEQIGGGLIMAHFEMNTEAGLGNVLLAKENNDSGQVQEKQVEELMKEKGSTFIFLRQRIED